MFPSVSLIFSLSGCDGYIGVVLNFPFTIA